MTDQRVRAREEPTDRRRTPSGRRWPDVVGLLARLVAGGVLVWAGLLKVGDPAGSVTAVRAYQLLPTHAADVVGPVLAPVEIAVGVCLVLGLLTRLAGGVSALLQLAFIIGVSSVWIRHIPIECGCFNQGGAAGPEAFAAYPWEIARDVGLLALSLWLVVRPRTPASVDGLLFRSSATRHDPLPDTEDDDAEDH